MVDDGDDGSGGVLVAMPESGWTRLRGDEGTRSGGEEHKEGRRRADERKMGIKQVGEARCSRLRNVQERFKVTY